MSEEKVYASEEEYILSDNDYFRDLIIKQNFNQKRLSLLMADNRPMGTKPGRSQLFWYRVLRSHFDYLSVLKIRRLVKSYHTKGDYYPT